MATKTPLQSKSIWFNGLSIVSLVGASLLADESFRELIGGFAIYLIIGVNVVNMVIRSYTVKPLVIKKAKIKLNPLEQALIDEAEEDELT